MGIVWTALTNPAFWRTAGTLASGYFVNDVASWFGGLMRRFGLIQEKGSNDKEPLIVQIVTIVALAGIVSFVISLLFKTKK